MNTQEIIAKAQVLAEDYDFIGIRTQEETFELGPIDHISHVWVDGEMTDEELDGICTTLIIDCGMLRTNFARDHKYFGDHVALIAGHDVTYGMDLGEGILSGAEVVYIIA